MSYIDDNYKNLWVKDISDDTFRRKTKVHDWRNHVPEDIIDNWSELSDRERKLVAIVAEVPASSEYWT